MAGNAPVPQTTIEFEVDDVEMAAKELADRGLSARSPGTDGALEADRGSISDRQ
jgi:hypothetical protein